MTIYIAGPMTGITDFNRLAFNAVTAALRAVGFDVVNPVELCPPGMEWTDCMRRDISALVACDSIALLPGWMDSRGARLERHIAVQLGMPVYDIGTLIEETDNSAQSFVYVEGKRVGLKHLISKGWMDHLHSHVTDGGALVEKTAELMWKERHP